MKWAVFVAVIMTASIGSLYYNRILRYAGNLGEINFCTNIQSIGLWFPLGDRRLAPGVFLAPPALILD
jgi:hypothetical protein